MNACKVTNRELGELRVVINGAGAAGTATFDLLSGMGVGDIIVNDLAGILCAGQVSNRPRIMFRLLRTPIATGDRAGLLRRCAAQMFLSACQWRGNRALI